MDDHDASRSMEAAVVALIVVLGVAIRLFACRHTYIVNPDGMYYIHQAKALYYGEWSQLTSCHLSYISISPFFIAIAYTLFHDWVIAGKFVSFFFGSITLIPLYYVCRRFFRRDISALTLLVFAVLPVLVSWSAGVLRDPVSWFFIVLGLYFFLVSGSRHERLAPLLSSISFILATWARIEASLFIIITLLYLVAVLKKESFKKLVFFMIPLFLLFVFIFYGVIFLEKPLIDLFRLDDIAEKFSAPFIAYETLRGDVQDLASHSLKGLPSHFMHKTHHIIWLIALGTLVRFMVRAYFYIFFILFVLGCAGVWRSLKEDRQVAYLFFLSGAAFIVLYLHVIQKWMMFDRFWTFFVLPAFIFIGFGLQKTVSIMTGKCRLKRSAALVITCLLILVFALPKNLKSKEEDKIVYKEMGELIAEREGNDEEIRVLSSLRTPNWPAFYANLDFHGVSCPLVDLGMGKAGLEKKVFKDYDTFVRRLRKEGIDYFLWEEKPWPKRAFDFLKAKRPEHLQKITSGRHPDAGRIILYKVAPRTTRSTPKNQ